MGTIVVTLAGRRFEISAVDARLLALDIQRQLRGQDANGSINRRHNAKPIPAISPHRYMKRTVSSNEIMGWLAPVVD